MTFYGIYTLIQIMQEGIAEFDVKTKPYKSTINEQKNFISICVKNSQFEKQLFGIKQKYTVID